MTDRISYTLREAADATGISERVIQRAYLGGQLPVHFVTSRPLILRTDLEEWIASAPTERALA